jgi:hypothetical protein
MYAQHLEVPSGAGALLTQNFQCQNVTEALEKGANVIKTMRSQQAAAFQSKAEALLKLQKVDASQFTVIPLPEEANEALQQKLKR